MKADLALSVSVNEDRPEEGSTITYTITVTNNGSKDATGVIVKDELPIDIRLTLLDIPGHTVSCFFRSLTRIGTI